MRVANRESVESPESDGLTPSAGTVQTAASCRVVRRAGRGGCAQILFRELRRCDDTSSQRRSGSSSPLTSTKVFRREVYRNLDAAGMATPTDRWMGRSPTGLPTAVRRAEAVRRLASLRHRRWSTDRGSVSCSVDRLIIPPWPLSPSDRIPRRSVSGRHDFRSRRSSFSAGTAVRAAEW